MDASIVVVSRDNLRLLERAIDSLTVQDFQKKSFEIILVDDGSDKDDYASFVKEKQKSFPNIRLVKQGKKGLSAGRNIGAKKANSIIIVYTDNDVIADKNWLKEMVKAFNQPGVIGVEGKITTDSPRKLFTHAPENLGGGKFIGANTAYLKDVIEKAGFYDEKMGYWREDSEFAFRAMRFGKIVFAGSAVIHHPLKKQGLRDMFRHLFFLRNDWVCILRHPSQYFERFSDSLAKDLGKSFAFWFSTISLLLGLSEQNIIMISLGVIGFALSFSAIFYGFAKSGFEKPAPLEGAVFGFLTWVKHLAYPFYFIYGFFDALLFMVFK